MKAASDISLFRNTNTQIVLLALAAIGIALRLFISWHVIGSNDAKLWEMHAIRVTHQGLLAAYDNYWFNHPPLSALGMTFLYWLAERVSVAPYFLFRLPGIIADAGSCLLIYRIISARKTPHDGAWAAALFSLCPLAIAISGYHCNTDSVYIFLCLLAAYYLTERNNATAGGVALGAAINIKLIPVLFIPAYYRYCRNHEQRLSFTLALAICAVPFLIPLLAATEPVVRHMLLYRSTYDWWGLRAAYYAILQPFGEVDASMQVLPSYMAVL